MSIPTSLVQGTVIDKNSSNPLQGVKISFTSSSFDDLTISDEDGYFELNIPELSPSKGVLPEEIINFTPVIAVSLGFDDNGNEREPSILSKYKSEFPVTFIDGEFSIEDFENIARVIIDFYNPLFPKEIETGKGIFPEAVLKFEVEFAENLNGLMDFSVQYDFQKTLNTDYPIFMDMSDNEFILGFEISKPLIKLPSINNNLLNNLTSPKITFSTGSYLLKQVQPYRGDKTTKEKLGLVELQSTSIKQLIPNISLTTPQIEMLTLPEKDVKYFTKEKIIKLLKEVLQRLLPIIQSMLLQFGMKLLNEEFEKQKEKISCPSKENLDKLIKKKNKLVKQINDIMKTIDISLKYLGFTEGILTVAEVAIKSTNATPVPTPPIVPFTVQQLETIVEVSNEIISSTTTLLTVLRSILDQVLTPLTQLDQLIQQCYPDADQVQLSEELQFLTNESQSPKITIVNGFTMDVEQELTEKPLKRKRAIAKNPSGLTILKGEWSFSSVDQILINELVFYIQTNNLKAD